MSYQIDVTSADRLMRQYVQGQLTLLEQPDFSLDEQSVCDILTQIVLGNGFPFVITVTNDRKKIIDGVTRFKVLAGAMLAPQRRRSLGLPEFFDHLKIANLNTNATETVLSSKASGPAWLPLSAALDTLDFLEWVDRVEAATTFSAAQARGIIRDGSIASRNLNDARVIIIRASENAVPGALRLDLNTKLN